MKIAAKIAGSIVTLVAVVNLVWFVAPVVGDPGVYRPLFAIALVVIASAVWRQISGKEHS